MLKPNVVISGCIEFDACRYNGDRINSFIVGHFKRHLNFIKVCPEVAIGLGTPREPVRLVGSTDQPQMMQPATQKDFTKSMRDFSDQFLDSLKDVDGFILKSRSPSCGIKDVKVYGAIENSPCVGKTSGLFAGRVLEHFPGLAIEDEGRLLNRKLREHFLTKIYTSARFRQVVASGQMKELVAFHSSYKYLLMAYNQSKTTALGRIVANAGKLDFQEICYQYKSILEQVIVQPPRKPTSINVLQHVYGYFKKDLSAAEKRHFAEELRKYRTGKLSIGALQVLLKSWVNRFNNQYLARQYFFEPFPADLVNLNDSGKFVKEY